MSDDPKIPDFESSLAELEALVEQMEHGELTLEQSLAQYEKGVRLTQVCQQALEQAQLRIDQLTQPTSSDSDHSESADDDDQRPADD